MRKISIVFIILMLLLSACDITTEDQIDTLATMGNTTYFKYKTKVAPTRNPVQQPTATLTATSIPDPTSTSLPTSTATLLPTDTPAPTSTATALPTNTATLFPTSTATLEPVAENTYYVSVTGNDSNNGSLESPWRTLSYAASRVQPGYTIIIRGGTYVEETDWSTDGTPTEPITVKAQLGEVVVIDGEDRIPANTGGNWMFMVWGDWYVVEGLEIKRSFDEGGIGVRGTNVTIRDNFVHHNWGAGITMMGDNGLAEDNRVWYNGVGNEFGSMSRGGWPAALTCARYPTNCTLRNNISWENWGEGISTFEAYNTTIEDNVSYDNMQNFYISDTKYTVLDGNLSYCTPGNPQADITSQSGIMLGDEKQNPPSSNNTVTNNIVYGCERNLAVGTTESNNNLIAYNTFVNAVDQTNILIYYGTTCTNCKFVNNIILQEDSLPIHIGSGTNYGWTMTNNLWSKQPSSNAIGINSIVKDPLFVKGSDPFSPEWYRLLPDSPAINQALELEVNYDYFDYTRYNLPDMGAIEYH